MKKVIILIVVIMSLIGCKSKSLVVDKTIEKKQVNYSKKFDSLALLYSELQQELFRKNSYFNRNFVLKSIPVFDSLGNRKPLNYRHYINGELAEEIYLDAGDLSEETQSKKAEETEVKNEVKKENVRIESDVGITSKSNNKGLSKTKEVEVKGFQFGFYAWLFFIVVVLIIIRQFTKKGG